MSYSYIQLTQQQLLHVYSFFMQFNFVRCAESFTFHGELYTNKNDAANHR